MSMQARTATAASVPATIPERMRAAVFRGARESLVVRELRTPKPGPGEALIRVEACGVCHTDLHVMKGEVRFVSPAVLGHEVSGTVVAIGSDAAGARSDQDAASAPGGIRIGSRVVGAFIMPCGSCRHCVRGRDDLCSSFFENNRLRGVLHDGTTRLFDLDGSPVGMYSMGGLAEYAVVPFTGLTPLPDSLPFAESAVLGCAGLTSYGAIRRSADLRVGETVAIVAVGGIGSNLVQLARAFGASTVIAIDVDDHKLAAARELGATHTVNSHMEDAAEAVRRATGGFGVDVAFEALGRPQTLEQASGLLGDGGRLIAVGIAPGTTTASIEITRMVRRGQRIIGNYGARVRADLPAVVGLAASGAFRPHGTVTRTYGLDEADAAFRALSVGEITGRAIVRP